MCNDIKELKRIKKIYEGLISDSTEEDNKIKVVLKLLHLLGYKEEWMSFEKRTPNSKDQCDIFIEMENNKKFLVEVKSKRINISKDDMSQILTYANNRNVQWCAITNGKRWMLAYTDLKIDNIDKFFMEFDLTKLNGNRDNRFNNLKVLKYFSYENIFKVGVTQYFVYFRAFEVEKLNDENEISKKQYKSAIYLFLDYLAEQKEFDMLELKPTNFENYIKNHIKNKRKIKKNTIRNKYRYIKSFVDYLEIKNYIKINRFKNYDIESFINELKFDEEENVKKENIEIDTKNMIDFYKNNLRNKIIVQLYLYTLNYQLLINLKIDDIYSNGIKFNNMMYYLPKNIMNDINSYIQINKIRKRKDNRYLITKRYNGKNNKINRDLIRKVIKKSIGNDIKDEKYLHQIFQDKFINDLYLKNIPIDIIAKFLDITPMSAYEHVEEENKKYNAGFKKIYKEHPIIR